MTVPTLPQEIIVDILSRLAVRTLMRFKCVCKSWCSLISSDPYLINLHLNRAMTNVRSHRVLLCITRVHPRIFCRTGVPPPSFRLQSIACEVVDDGPFMMFDVHARFKGENPDIVGSCNGLICLEFDDGSLVLFNPSTGSYKKLPEPNLHSDFYSDILIAEGFGYDSSAGEGDYKIVRVFEHTSSGYNQGDIFSLRTNSWRKIKIPDNYFNGYLGQGTFWNGALYWTEKHDEGNWVIISFDLTTEEFQEVLPLVPPPHDLQNGGYFTFLNCNWTVLDGLPMFRSSYRNFHELWVRRECGVQASLTNMFTISFDEAKPAYKHFMMSICLSKDGKLLLNVDGERLVMYNPEAKTFRSIVDSGGHWDTFGTSGAAAYVESLVSPNGFPGA